MCERVTFIALINLRILILVGFSVMTKFTPTLLTHSCAYLEQITLPYFLLISPSIVLLVLAELSLGKSSYCYKRICLKQVVSNACNALYKLLKFVRSCNSKSHYKNTVDIYKTIEVVFCIPHN